MPDPSLSERVEVLGTKSGGTRSITGTRGKWNCKFCSSAARCISALGGRISAVEARLREEIRAGDEETRRYMRVLHEEVISRIATIGESRRPGKRKRKP